MGSIGEKEGLWNQEREEWEGDQWENTSTKEKEKENGEEVIYHKEVIIQLK